MTLEELKQRCLDLSLPWDDSFSDKLQTYASLLKEWNERMNLTSILEPKEIYEKHFFDSIISAKMANFSDKKVLDIGSGAGFPGMIIALFYPTASVTLLDSTNKKFLFLEEVKNALGLTNVSFVAGRVEEQKNLKETFDITISRAFANLSVFLEVAAPLTKGKGSIVALKGKKGEEELHQAQNAIYKLRLRLAQTESLELPSGDQRILYRFEKKEPTPKRYPRRWAEIMEKPL